MKDYRLLEKYNNKEHDRKNKNINVSIKYNLKKEINNYCLYFIINSANYYSPVSEFKLNRIKVEINNLFNRFLVFENNCFNLTKKQYYLLKYLFEDKYNNIFIDINKYFYLSTVNNKKKYQTIFKYLIHISNIVKENNFDNYLKNEINNNNKLIFNENIQNVISNTIKEEFNYLIDAKNFDLL